MQNGGYPKDNGTIAVPTPIVAGTITSDRLLSVLALVSFLYRNIGFNTFLGYTIFFFTHRTTSFKELFVHFLHRTIRFKDGLTAENFNKNTQLD